MKTFLCDGKAYCAIRDGPLENLWGVGGGGGGRSTEKIFVQEKIK